MPAVPAVCDSICISRTHCCGKQQTLRHCQNPSVKTLMLHSHSLMEIQPSETTINLHKLHPSKKYSIFTLNSISHVHCKLTNVYCMSWKCINSLQADRMTMSNQTVISQMTIA